jgi:hypothetical protein
MHGKDTGVHDFRRHGVRKRASHNPPEQGTISLDSTASGDDAVYPDYGIPTTVEVPAVVVLPVIGDAIEDHEAAVDPHLGYQKESEKSQPDGYASLGPDGLVPLAELPPLAQSLDDLTDVTIASVASGDHLRYAGGEWRNSRHAWIPLTTVIAGVPELVWDADNSLIPTEVP